MNFEERKGLTKRKSENGRLKCQTTVNANLEIRCRGRFLYFCVIPAIFFRHNAWRIRRAVWRKRESKSILDSRSFDRLRMVSEVEPLRHSGMTAVNFEIHILKKF